MCEKPLGHPAFAFYTMLFSYFEFVEYDPDVERNIWVKFNRIGDTLLSLRPEALNDLFYLKHTGVTIKGSQAAKVICEGVFKSLHKILNNMGVNDLFKEWLKIAKLKRSHFILCELEPLDPEQPTTVIIQTETLEDSRKVRDFLNYLQLQIGPDVIIFQPT